MRKHCSRNRESTQTRQKTKTSATLSRCCRSLPAQFRRFSRRANPPRIQATPPRLSRCRAAVRGAAKHVPAGAASCWAGAWKLGSGLSRVPDAGPWRRPPTAARFGSSRFVQSEAGVCLAWRPHAHFRRKQAEKCARHVGLASSLRLCHLLLQILWRGGGVSAEPQSPLGGQPAGESARQPKLPSNGNGSTLSSLPLFLSLTGRLPP